MTYGEYFQIIIIYLPQLNKKQKKSLKPNRFDPNSTGYSFYSVESVSIFIQTDWSVWFTVLG